MLFISHADSDSDWVERQLIPALEDAGLTCNHEALFTLGKPRLLEFEKAINHCDRILLICSPAFFADESLRIVDLLAAQHGEETKSWPVIPIIRHAVELPLRLRILESLDATDQASWPDALTRLCNELKVDTPQEPKRPRCPYPGMKPFERDSEFPFYGRQEEIGEIMKRLRLHSFLAVIGASGSGKSSLVHAGLIPELNRTQLLGEGNWLTSSFRPSEGNHDQTIVSRLEAHLGGQVGDPESAKASVDSLLRLAREASQPNAQQLLLVVDQFEEVYTLQKERDEKFRLNKDDADQFQRALLTLADVPGCYVVLTVRADFFGDLMESPIWHKGVKEHRFELTTLGDEGMRQAIVQPALNQEVCIDQVLVERLLAEAGSEPGILPFLQETLVLLWGKLRWRYLSPLDYESMVRGRRAEFRSGLEVAMAQRADAAISSLPDDEHRLVARRILLRLVQFGEGRLHTRRQQTVAKLSSAHADIAIFEKTLTHLTKRRLLTIGDPRANHGRLDSGTGDDKNSKNDLRSVDIAHDKLITGWPVLCDDEKGWIVLRRQAEETRRDLEGKVMRWVDLGRKRFGGGLLDKVQLAECDKWIESNEAAEIGEVPGLHQLQRVSQQRLWLRRAGVVSIPVLAIIAMGFWIWGVYAIAAEESQRAEAEKREKEAAEEHAATEKTLRIAADKSAASALFSLASRENSAGRLANAALYYDLAAQLIPKDHEEHRWSSRLANSCLLRAGQAIVHDSSVLSLALSQTGNMIATGTNSGDVFVWNADTRRPLHGQRMSVGSFATDCIFVDDKRLLVMGLNEVALFETTSGRKLSSLADEYVHTLLAGADGAALLGENGGYRVVSFGDPRASVALPSSDTTTYAVSKQKRFVASVANDGSVTVFDAKHWELGGRIECKLATDDQLVGLSDDGSSIFVIRKVADEQLHLEQWQASSKMLRATWRLQEAISHVWGSGEYLTGLVNDSQDVILKLSNGQAEIIGASFQGRRIGQGVGMHIFGDSRIFWSYDVFRTQVDAIDLDSERNLGMTFQHPDVINSLIVDEKRRRVITACADGIARIWTLKEAAKPLDGWNLLPGSNGVLVPEKPDGVSRLKVVEQLSLGGIVGRNIVLNEAVNRPEWGSRIESGVLLAYADGSAMLANSNGNVGWLDFRQVPSDNSDADHESYQWLWRSGQIVAIAGSRVFVAGSGGKVRIYEDLTASQLRAPGIIDVCDDEIICLGVSVDGVSLVAATAESIYLIDRGESGKSPAITVIGIPGEVLTSGIFVSPNSRKAVINADHIRRTTLYSQVKSESSIVDFDAGTIRDLDEEAPVQRVLAVDWRYSTCLALVEYSRGNVDGVSSLATGIELRDLQTGDSLGSATEVYPAILEHRELFDKFGTHIFPDAAMIELRVDPPQKEHSVDEIQSLLGVVIDDTGTVQRLSQAEWLHHQSPGDTN